VSTTPKETLLEAIFEFIGNRDLLDRDGIRAALEREIDRDGPDSLQALIGHLSADTGWAYYPPDPIARRVHHLLAEHFLSRESRVEGITHAAAVSGSPVVIAANHLSYSDANVIEILLHRAGGAAAILSDRLTALAGPKVFTSRKRRFSSLCFGTVKVPQSAEVSSDEAVLDARQVARAARQSIAVAQERLAAGDALVLFGEGTRSRSGGMQRLLAAVARYLEVPGTWILPAGLTGSEALFPVDGTLQPARVTLTLGRPLLAEALMDAAGDRRVAVDAVGLWIAQLLPPEYRGVYAETGDMPAARDALQLASR
jgi:1-acyl-sn-glycerol-3-phosphate acyltransferase